ncbi:MAG: Hsp33 family molecular chaperone HslO [Lentisphaeria bacterium]|nr:Hsp33 family molecular chaperone HslO [Lentisphaeria bacterium]
MNGQKDFLYRGILESEDTRLSYAVCTETVNTAVLRHGCDPLSAHLLCRALGAGVLAAPLLGPGETYTLRWEYEGAAKTVMVVVDADCQIRGFVANPEMLSCVDGEESVYGSGGRVTVVKGDADGCTLNTGTCEAALLDVVEDFAYFLCVSDQTETGMVVMVGFRQDPEAPVALCQGLMVQALPGCDPERFDIVRGRLGSSEVRALLSAPPRNDNHLELIARALAGNTDTLEPLRLAASPSPRFQCQCTHERMRDVLAVAGATELRDMVEKREPVVVSCRFCSSRHTFDLEEIGELLAEI